MKTNRYVELRILEAIEYIKYSDEDSWSFVVRVGDKKICFTGDKIEANEIEKKNEAIKRFTEALDLMDFSVDKMHIIELINDLKVVKEFKYINECINELDNFRDNEIANNMNTFTITPNEFLSRNTQAYYQYDYTTYGTEGNPDFINHLKNQFGDTSVSTLQNAVNELTKVLQEDLPKIKSLHNTNLTVCVIPRAKAESHYSDNQKLFKRVISSVVDKLIGFTNGTSYMIRNINTRTTHMNRSGYGGDGAMPYVGITKATCKISRDVRGKDILLIDDIFTKDVNIDEDAIQALYDYGARNVIFYSVAKTYKGGIKTVIKSKNLELLKPHIRETYIMLTKENNLNDLANSRGVTKGTIINHLAEISEVFGKDSVNKFKPSFSTINQVIKAINKLGARDKLKPIFEELGEEISYDDIKLCLIYID